MLERRECRRHGQDAVDDDEQARLPALRELAREGFDLTRLREQPAPFCQHGFACSREAHAVTLTIQQRDAELLFELSHLITDGRLYLVQLLRGACETAEANDGVQSFHGVEVESHDVLYF